MVLTDPCIQCRYADCVEPLSALNLSRDARTLPLTGRQSPLPAVDFCPPNKPTTPRSGLSFGDFEQGGAYAKARQDRP
jgi:hypothetical protein